MGVTARINSVGFRLWALSMSAWGAVLGMFAPTTLPARLHDAFDNPMNYVNLLILAGVALGFADAIWHDIRGKLIMPHINCHFRHRVCVSLYAFLGASWLLKAFVTAHSIGAVPAAEFMLGFSINCAVLCGAVAVSLALEQRHD